MQLEADLTEVVEGLRQELLASSGGWGRAWYSWCWYNLPMARG